MGENLMSLMNRTGGGYAKFGAGTTMLKTIPTASDYDLTNTVIQFDGIETGGYNTKATGTTWQSCLGNIYFPVAGFGDDYAISDSSINHAKQIQSLYTFGDDLTFEAVIKTGESNYNWGMQSVVCIERHNYGINGFDLFATQGNNNNLRYIAFIQNYGTGTNRKVFDVNNLTLNTWYHEAIVYKKSTREMSAYLNGQLVGQVVIPSDYEVESTVSVLNICGSVSGSWQNKIGSIRISNAVKSDSVIAANYEIDKIRFNMP